MAKFFFKFLLTFMVAVCTLVALFCPWGFWCAFEPGQEKWLVIYPIMFVVAAGVGFAAQRLLRKL